MPKKCAAKKRPAQGLRESDLGRWKLLGDFQERLREAAGAARGTWADPRRELSQVDYLSLLLFGLFNPVVESMRGRCAASALGRVQREVCRGSVSLGSFSEAQGLVDPGLLEKVFHDLAAEVTPPPGAPRDARLAAYRQKLIAIDGTLWAALPRMAWAFWRQQHGRQGALKLHLKFNVLEEKPVGALIAPAKRCERSVLRELAQAGEFYVGDRYYGEDYALFGELKAAGCSFVLRLRQEACWEVMEEYPLTPEDRAAGVRSDALVRLGARSKSAPWRLVRVAGPREELLLVSDLGPEELAAELVGQVYRARWRIELFFKWIKCILGCGHWLAESERGVALQIYCALIAALLLLAHSGRRPGKRAMEMIRFYLLGTATLEELCTQLGLEKKRA